jgi:hypothetical protein
MKLFKQKYMVCKECGVHYDLVSEYEIKWKDLCPTHRKPVMEKDLRKDDVMYWASYNWERLEKLYLEERKKQTQPTQEQLQRWAKDQLNAKSSIQCLGNQGNISNPFGIG